jgi:hypothetical protein
MGEVEARDLESRRLSEQARADAVAAATLKADLEARLARSCFRLTAAEPYDNPP